MFKVPERYRVTTGQMASDSSIGNQGAFLIKRKGNKNPDLAIIASDQMGWEHVSVSTLSRCPTWEEMCWVKDMFWGPNDCVIQYHPPEIEYVNNHPYTLHLWRPVSGDIPMPPSIMV